jgi:hypothetical protein
MNYCPFCDRNNREGALICEHCSRPLAAFTALQTRVVDETPADVHGHWQGNVPFNDDTQIILFVRDKSDVLVLPRQERLVLGRANIDQSPDIDLTQYDALDHGVSSAHAALERRDDALVITDLASTNGTYVNRKRIHAHQPVMIHDGAEVHLGRLAIRIYFESTAIGPLQ